MGITVLLAIVCIVLGFVSAALDEVLLLNSLGWFVAALAFNTLGADYTIGRKQ